MNEHKNEIEIANIEDSIVVPLTDDNQLNLAQDSDTGVFYLSGYDDYLDMVARMSDQLDNYVFQDGDRAMVRVAGAEFNKLMKAIKSDVHQTKLNLFKPVDEDVKVLVERLTELRQKIVKGRDRQDEIDRKEKDNYLREMFDDIKFNLSNITDLEISYDQVSDVKWLNRSTSHTKAGNELHQRLSNLDGMIDSGLLPSDVTTKEMVHALNHVDWDSLSAVKYIKDQRQLQAEVEERKRIEREIAEKMKQEREQSKADTQVQSNTQSQPQLVSLMVQDSDLEKVQKFLDENEIWYRI